MDTLFDKYKEKVKQYFPLWFNPLLNGDIEERFHSKFEEIQETLFELKRRDNNWVDVDVTRQEVYDVFLHLLDTYSYSIMSHNAWYALQNAQSRGLLDVSFFPVFNAQPVDSLAEETEANFDSIKDSGGSSDEIAELQEFYGTMQKINNEARNRL